MPVFARPLLFASLAALTLAGCGSADPAATQERLAVAKLAEQGNGELALSDASVKLNANPAAPSAAYFTVKAGDLPATITGVQTADADRAELHESKMDGGVMRMNAVTDVDVAANGEVRFRQGGLHVMLFGLSDAARAAGKLVLTVSFADGTTRDIEAPLMSATGTPVAAAPRPVTPAVSVPAHGSREIVDNAMRAPPPVQPKQAETPAAPAEDHAGH